MVKSVDSEHVCTRNMEKNKLLYAKWVAQQFLDVLKTRPHLPTKEISDSVKKAYDYLVKKPFAYHVMYNAYKMLHGSMLDYYNNLGK